MIAANDAPLPAWLLGQSPSQLRQLIAHAAGLLAHHESPLKARSVLHNVADAVWRKPTLKTLAAEFCAAEGVTEDELRGDKRGRAYAWPRQHFMYLAVKVYGKSYSAVGRFLNRDHTTVLHGIRAHKERAGL